MNAPDEFEPSITPRIYAASITVPEHKELRDAIDLAQVTGQVTWIRNTAGAPIAAIVPRGMAELGLTAWAASLPDPGVNASCVRCSGGAPRFCACITPCAFPGCGARPGK